MNEQLKAYLTNLLPSDEEWVYELQQQAVKDNVPIMDSLGMNFVMQLIRLNNPGRILEIGTAIGYSALRMLQANPDAEIVTIEKDEHRYEQAIQNIKKQSNHQKIQLIHGDALEEMEHLAEKHERFDCIFIDAAKGHYKRFFELSIPLLNDNGFIISDNVLFRGYVADSDFHHRRYNNIVRKLREYNEWLTSHPDFVSCIVPIGDGVAVSYKNSRKGART